MSDQASGFMCCTLATLHLTKVYRAIFALCGSAVDHRAEMKELIAHLIPFTYLVIPDLFLDHGLLLCISAMHSLDSFDFWEFVNSKLFASRMNGIIITPPRPAEWITVISIMMFSVIFWILDMYGKANIECIHLCIQLIRGSLNLILLIPFFKVTECLWFKHAVNIPMIVAFISIFIASLTIPLFSKRYRRWVERILYFIPWSLFVICFCFEISGKGQYHHDYLSIYPLISMMQVILNSTLA